MLVVYTLKWAMKALSAKIASDRTVSYYREFKLGYKHWHSHFIG